MPRSNAWKALEKTVAEGLNGIRIHRGGDFSESLPDVIAPLDSIITTAPYNYAIVVECKYRAKQPWIDLYKETLKKFKGKKFLSINKKMVNPLTNMDDEFIILPFSNLKEYFDNISITISSNTKKKIPSYLLEYCSQSRTYINDLDIRDQVQLLYYKATKCRTRPPFVSYSSMAVIGQKNDKTRLACFFRSEFKNVLNA